MPLPGPVSNAMTRRSPGRGRGGRYVALPIPPIFCTIRPRLGSPKSHRWASGASARRFAAEREVHHAEIREHRHTGHRGDYRGLTELERRGRLPAARAARRQMVEGMAVRADEVDPMRGDMRELGNLQRDFAERPAEDEIELRNLTGADALAGRSGEQARTQIFAIGERLEGEQPQRWRLPTRQSQRPPR